MKIAVTGGAGFIASHVADAFVAAGHDVLVIDNLSSGRRENVPARAEFVQADIRDDAAGVAVREFAPQVLCHHAAQMDVRRSVREPLYDAEVNVLGTLRMLEASPTLERVIFASSGGAIYGEQDEFPATESHAQQPASPYGASKAAGEIYLRTYAQTRGLKAVALRYANVYGPRQNPHGEAGVVAIFCERLVRGEACFINGDGEQTRDYVFVGDVVRANLAALASEQLGAVNIGTGIETSVNQLYAQLADSAGVSAKAQHRETALGEQRRSVISAARAKAWWGYAPRVALADGLAQTFSYFKKRNGS